MTGDGFYRKCLSGPFTLFIFMHAIGEDGPSSEDLSLVDGRPQEYAICYDTRDIARGEFFIYGDETDEVGRPGLLLISGRGSGEDLPDALKGRKRQVEEKERREAKKARS